MDRRSQVLQAPFSKPSQEVRHCTRGLEVSLLVRGMGGCLGPVSLQEHPRGHSPTVEILSASPGPATRRPCAELALPPEPLAIAPGTSGQLRFEVSRSESGGLWPCSHMGPGPSRTC